MAHNLNGNRMFFYGQKPWHNLGVELNNPATAREAIEAAQLDYKIDLQPIFLRNNVEIENAKATVRRDTNQALGIVTDRYKIVQNIEAFDFFDNVVGEKEAIYHTAGALNLGERIWILAKLPKDIILTKEDIVEKYLCLTNSHDGLSALKLYFTPVRVVCQNTLIASMKDSRDGISIRHMGDIKNKVAEAQRVLGITIDYYKRFEEIAKQLVKRQMSVADTKKYYDNLLFAGKDPNDISTNAVNKRNRLLYLFENGLGNKITGVRHTAWSALNAVTEFIDHDRNVKNLSKDPTNKLRNIWFGSGAQFKQRAYNEILELCEISKN